MLGNKAARKSAVFFLLKASNTALASVWSFLLAYALVRIVGLESYAFFATVIAFASLVLQADLGISIRLFGQLRQNFLHPENGSRQALGNAVAAALASYAAIAVLATVVFGVMVWGLGLGVAQYHAIYLLLFAGSVLPLPWMILRLTANAFDYYVLTEAIDCVRRTLLLALTAALAYLAVAVFDPAMPSIIAALPIGLIGGQRRAFTWGNALGGPGAMIVLSYVMVWIVSHLQAMPLVYVGAMWLTYFLCFLMILRTGAQLGMLIIIIAVLMSVMGMNSIAAAEAMRDGFTQASLLSLVLGPLVYALLPARTAELHVSDPQPAPGNVGVGAAIRASLLLLVSLWLYTVLQPSDIMLAMITAMVLVFPTGKAALAEANERVLATLYGGAMTAAVLALVTLMPHLPVLLALLFLGGLWLGQRMLTGRHPAPVYQYALSVALALIAGALSSQDPAYAAFTRIALTIAGAYAATLVVALLDALTGWSDPAPRATA